MTVAVFRSDAPAFADATAIRLRVFVEEQQVPLAEELDEFESDATHFLIKVDGTPAATGRVRIVEDNIGKLERIATLQEYRGQGLGRALMETMMDYLRAQGVTRFMLSSQVRSRGFYESLGFSAPPDAPVYLDANIPHVMMYA
ncbi:MAG: GNAT family N-acetyltransferase [Alphaproteobacteria bacterium]|nr:GNAT family N-acetyltransferase [Alphaproteobacteria bacterium]